jgi:hypothetical protein
MTKQWFKNGDHPEDNCQNFISSDSLYFKGEGSVVRYYRIIERGWSTKNETLYL